MPIPADMRARHSRILAELSEIGLTVVRDLQARVLAADDIKAASDAALALHRILRSVRQTLALEAKLERDRQRDLVEETARAAASDKVARTRRYDQVRAAVARLTWTEQDPDEVESINHTAVELLDEDILSDTFLTEPLDAHIERICKALGMLPSANADEDVSPKPDG